MEFFGLSESTIRLSVFASIFITMAIAEAVLPRKSRTQTRGHRWFTNWSLVVLDTLALRIIFPVLAVGMATYSEARGWGLLNVLPLPLWLEIVIAILLLDLAIYAQHVAVHKVSMLWKFHKVHHADRDIDVTTGARFHPAEIILSMAYKLVCVALLGPAAVAVFLFEVVLNASAMFNHSNVKLPLMFDRYMRAIIVTPDMHRVHHSIIRRETDSNFGFFLSVWDRIFRTYIAQPKLGHSDIVIGLEEYQSDEPSGLIWSLLLPFKPDVQTQASIPNSGAKR